MFLQAVSVHSNPIIPRVRRRDTRTISHSFAWPIIQLNTNLLTFYTHAHLNLLPWQKITRHE